MKRDVTAPGAALTLVLLATRAFGQTPCVPLLPETDRQLHELDTIARSEAPCPDGAGICTNLVPGAHQRWFAIALTRSMQRIDCAREVAPGVIHFAGECTERCQRRLHLLQRYSSAATSSLGAPDPTCVEVLGRHFRDRAQDIELRRICGWLTQDLVAAPRPVAQIPASQPDTGIRPSDGRAVDSGAVPGAGAHHGGHDAGPSGDVNPHLDPRGPGGWDATKVPAALLGLVLFVLILRRNPEKVASDDPNTAAPKGAWALLKRVICGNRRRSEGPGRTSETGAVTGSVAPATMARGPSAGSVVGAPNELPHGPGGEAGSSNENLVQGTTRGAAPLSPEEIRSVVRGPIEEVMASEFHKLSEALRPSSLDLSAIKKHLEHIRFQVDEDPGAQYRGLRKTLTDGATKGTKHQDAELHGEVLRVLGETLSTLRGAAGEAQTAAAAAKDAAAAAQTTSTSSQTVASAATAVTNRVERALSAAETAAKAASEAVARASTLSVECKTILTAIQEQHARPDEVDVERVSVEVVNDCFQQWFQSELSDLRAFIAQRVLWSRRAEALHAFVRAAESSAALDERVVRPARLREAHEALQRLLAMETPEKWIEELVGASSAGDRVATLRRRLRDDLSEFMRALRALPLQATELDSFVRRVHDELGRNVTWRAAEGYRLEGRVPLTEPVRVVATELFASFGVSLLEKNLLNSEATGRARHLVAETGLHRTQQTIPGRIVVVFVPPLVREMREDDVVNRGRVAIAE